MIFNVKIKQIFNIILSGTQRRQYTTMIRYQFRNIGIDHQIVITKQIVETVKYYFESMQLLIISWSV